MVFPEPGGPIISMLWFPAAAISNALFKFSWDFISEKSTSYSGSRSIGSTMCDGAISRLPFKKSTVSFRVFTGYTFTSSRIEHSIRFSYGTTNFLNPISLIERTIGRTPSIGTIFPSSPSSPKKTKSSVRLSSMTPSASRIEIAIGRSVCEPSFFMFAGERFIVIFFCGKRNPLLKIAAVHLSLLSFIALSARPTIVKLHFACARSHSTFSSAPTMPSRTALLMLEYITPPSSITIKCVFNMIYIILIENNFHNVKSDRYIRPIHFSHKAVRNIDNVTNFFIVNGVLRISEHPILSRLNLDKNEKLILNRNDVHFSVSISIISLKNHVAMFFKIFGGHILPEISYNFVI